MEVRPEQQNEMQFLSSSGHVDTAVWMHYMDANKTYGEKLDSNYKRMLRAILNKSWRQHPTKQQLYSHLPPIMKTIQVRRTKHASHCWRSKDKLISDVLLWTPSHGRAKTGQPARTCIQQLSADSGSSLKDVLESMDNREGQWERVREIRAWWWRWWTFIWT